MSKNVSDSLESVIGFSPDTMLQWALEDIKKHVANIRIPHNIGEVLMDGCVKAYMEGVMRGHYAAWLKRQPEIDAANARIKQLEDANRALIEERDQLKSATVDRHELQAKGEHPAPCGRFCEANAYQIAERGYLKQINDLRAANGDLKAHFDALKADYDTLLKEREETLNQEPVAWRKEIISHGIRLGYVYPTISHSKIQSECEKLYANPKPPAIPKGYELVPVELTKELKQFLFHRLNTVSVDKINSLWDGIIAASQKASE